MTTDEIMNRQNNFTLETCLLFIALTMTTNLHADTGQIIPTEGIVLGLISIILYVSVLIFGLYGLLVLLRPIIGRRKKTRRKDLLTMLSLIVLFPAIWRILENQFRLLDIFGFDFEYGGLSQAIFVFSVLLGVVLGYRILPQNDAQVGKEAQVTDPKDLMEKMRIKGRIRIKHFIALQFAILIVLYFLYRAKGSYFGDTLFASTAALLFYAVIIFEFVVVARRLQDCGINPFFSLVIFVPYVNFLLILFLCFKPGQFGENKYGADSHEEKSV